MRAHLLVQYSPRENDKVEELCERDEGDESGRRVVGQHDGDQDEGPDQEADGEEQPEDDGRLQLLLGADDQEDVDEGVPKCSTR